MKFTVSGRELNSTMGVFTGIKKVDPSLMPVHKNLELVVKGDCLLATRISPRTTLTLAVEADVVREGTCYIDSSRFFDAIKPFYKDERIEIELKKSALSMKSGNTQFNLRTTKIKPEEMPRIDDSDAIFFGALDSKLIIESIKGAEYAASRTQRVSYLDPKEGLNIETLDGCLNFVCLDGIRIVVRSIDFGKTLSDKLSHTIPLQALVILRKFLERNDTVEIWYKEDRLFFRSSDSSFGFLCINKDYPKYHPLINYEHLLVSTITLNKQETINQLGIIKTISPTEVKFELKDGYIVLSAMEPGVGTVGGKIDDVICEKGYSFKMNTNHLIEMISHSTETESVTIQICEEVRRTVTAKLLIIDEPKYFSRLTGIAERT